MIVRCEYFLQLAPSNEGRLIFVLFLLFINLMLAKHLLFPPASCRVLFRIVSNFVRFLNFKSFQQVLQN